MTAPIRGAPTGLVADNSLGASPSARSRLLGLPDVGDDGLFFAFGKLGNGFSLAIIEVAVGVNAMATN